MKLIIFGTVIRTRRSLGKVIRQAVAEKRTDSDLFRWAINIYNSGIFGLLIYRTNDRYKGKDFFTNSK